MPESTPATVRVFAAKSWLQSQAVDQLKKAAELPGVQLAVGLPDLHPGPGAPVGAAVVTEGILYPTLAGNDIGCGIGLWATELEARRAHLDRWVKKLKGLETAPDEDPRGKLEGAGLPFSGADYSLGTIGGGNHFAEMQSFEEVRDAELFRSLGLDADRMYLLIHSGSRGLGEIILRDHLAKHGHNGLTDAGERADYRKAHDHAVRWAAVNRAAIAERFAEMVGTQTANVLDNCHNSITVEDWAGANRYIHRKGAGDAGRGPLVIPGSRGTLSYLVLPTGDRSASAHSVAHGAGRKWKRSDARGRLSDHQSADSLTRTALGGRVICADRDLLYEEAPQAYKEIETVIEDLVTAGLVKVIATLRPRITYKTRAK